MKDLFEITTVDPEDKLWLEEYNKRIAAGETEEKIKLNPPFGIPQRPLKKMENIGNLFENLI